MIDHKICIKVFTIWRRDREHTAHEAKDEEKSNQHLGILKNRTIVMSVCKKIMDYILLPTLVEQYLNIVEIMENASCYI
jgi:hypothetical protein